MENYIGEVICSFGRKGIVTIMACFKVYWQCRVFRNFSEKSQAVFFITNRHIEAGCFWVHTEPFLCATVYRVTKFHQYLIGISIHGRGDIQPQVVVISF